MAAWPSSARELVQEQQALARERPPAWRPFEQTLAPSAEATRDWSDVSVRALPEPPEVVLVNATGRDHPRRAGLALQLGSVLELPTVGVTDRPLLAVHPAWRTDLETAVALVCSP